MKNILILGGYGRAGRNIAELLAKHSETQLLIAGRNLKAAENCAVKLSKKYPDTIFKAIRVDIEDREQLTAALEDIQLMIVCIPLDYPMAKYLIEAVLQSPEAHYIDLSPGRGKLKAFREWEEAIQQNGKLFILDAGFEPGLPGFLARLAADQLTDPQSLLIEGIYRDTHIPEGGIKDILEHDEPPRIYRGGYWREAGGLQIRRVDFPRGFGKALSIPVGAPELEAVPEEYGLESLSYYHAGINAVSNLIMLAWQGGLRRFLPLKIGVFLFRLAIRYFTGRPYGGVIQVLAEGRQSTVRVLASHAELYEATAIPVAATALLILERPDVSAGAFFMGQWVERKRFLGKLKEIGLEVSLS